jgi:MinD-like ATPase involved in chromosome partitioning or flagellar assembly
MSEHHDPEFDDRQEAPGPVSEPPSGPLPGVQRPPRRMPVTERPSPEGQNAFGPPPPFGGAEAQGAWQGGHGPLPGEDSYEAGENSGAHRADDPAATDDAHTSVMPLNAIPDYAREEYRRRIAGDAEADQDNPSRAAWQDLADRAYPQPPPPAGRGTPPPPRPRPRSAWPEAAARPEQRGPHLDDQYQAPGAPGQRWTGEQRGWDQSQGSAANWNYTDSIRAGELVPTRRTPPRRGWRKALYVGSGKLINPGQSPDERYEDELVAKCRTLLRGKYKIGILGKGGAGKSTTAAGVGSIFAELRQDDRVVAIDADTAFGKLTSRIDPNASGSYWELAGDRHLHSFADIRARVGSNNAGLFVLGGDAAAARRRQLDPDIYKQATIQLDRHFTLSIVDCGSTLDADITLEVLGDVDALIVVSSPWFDGASAAGQTLEWLANNGFTGLLARTVVVINDSDGHASKNDLKRLAERFGGRGQRVIEMPYDEHLRPGGVVDVQSGVSKVTRRRLLELAAHCAEHFASTTDSPRGYQ